MIADDAPLWADKPSDSMRGKHTFNYPSAVGLNWLWWEWVLSRQLTFHDSAVKKNCKQTCWKMSLGWCYWGRRVCMCVCIIYNVNINALYIIIFKRSKVGKLGKTIWKVVSGWLSKLWFGLKIRNWGSSLINNLCAARV